MEVLLKQTLGKVEGKGSYGEEEKQAPTRGEKYMKKYMKPQSHIYKLPATPH